MAGSRDSGGRYGLHLSRSPVRRWRRRNTTRARPTPRSRSDRRSRSRTGVAYGAIGKVQAAHIKMINEQGGVNGRKINLIQYDDATIRLRLSSRCASWSKPTRF